MNSATPRPATATRPLAARAIDLTGVEAAIHCANVISQQAAELEALRAERTQLIAAAKDGAVHLRAALEEMAAVVAMSGETSASRMARARVVDVVGLLDRVTP